MDRHAFLSKSMSALAPSEICGLVLAGGRSSRLGEDKTQLSLDGQSFLEHALDVMSDCAGRVFVSIRHGQQLAYPQELCIEDEKEGYGPLEAVYSALKQLNTPLLVMPCDLPFMDSSTLQALLAAHNKAVEQHRKPYLTSYQQAETGYIEALVALYRPESLPFFAQARASGFHQLNLVVPLELQEHIVYTATQGTPFRNINTAEDWEAARTFYMTLKKNS